MKGLRLSSRCFIRLCGWGIEAVRPLSVWSLGGGASRELSLLEDQDSALRFVARDLFFEKFEVSCLRFSVWGLLVVRGF